MEELGEDENFSWGQGFNGWPDVGGYPFKHAKFAGVGYRRYVKWQYWWGFKPNRICLHIYAKYPTYIKVSRGTA